MSTLSQRDKREGEWARRADERAYHAIWTSIQEGRYRRGDRLFEEPLAKELGLSRTPVRAALARLGFERIVEFDISGGARVVHWSESDLVDAFTVRALLEGWAAAEATRNMTPEMAEHLSSLVEAQSGMAKINREHSTQIVVELGLDFHQTIAELSGNRWLVELRQFLIRLPLVNKIYVEYTTADQEQCVEDHRLVVDAMLAGDAAGADREMRRHIEHQFEVVKKVFLESEAGQEGADLPS